ncbi:MAG: flagellar hook-length control protein FliK [Alphaproteobacteria bacterium]|nr:flagellar hook-length control protein FliK [Alphaproteobacteria bacterium]
MSASIFLTQQIQTNPAKIPAGKPVHEGDPALQGLGFLGLLLAQIAKNDDENLPTGTEPGETLLQSENPALTKKPGLDIAQLLAENPEIAEEVKNFTTDEQNALSETLALNSKAFDDLLKPLTGQSTTLDSTADAHNKTMDFLLKNKELIEKLYKSIEGNTFDISNLTPGQITALKSKTENILKQLDIFIKNNEINDLSNIKDDLSGILSALATLLPSQPPYGQNGLPLGQRLNAIPVGFNADGVEGDGENSPRLLFDKIMERLAEKGLGAEGKKSALPGLGNGPLTAKADSQAFTPGFAQGWPFASGEGLELPPGFDTSLLEKFGVHAPGNGVSTPSALTSLVTQTSGAAQAHPATQMVAATLQKSASSGENKSILLQLDPPELGRVQIKMHFGHDKTLKASLIAEKPETYMMLQRDAHILERALQDAGLDADGSSLSFELAQDGEAFERHANGKNHGSNHDPNAPNNNADSESLIETTMTWRVDPETGRMRLNMVA